MTLVSNWLLAALSLATGILVGGFRMLKADSDKIAADLAAHQLLVASQYATRTDVREMEGRLERRFDKLEELLVQYLSQHRTGASND